MLAFLSNYIYTDQVGFLPHRQAGDQVRQAIDLISLLHSSWDEAVARYGLVLSLNIRNVFDSLSWLYPFHLLEKWNFSAKFLASLHSLYSTPSAQFILRGHKLDPLVIFSGTRKSCSLSPLLFLIAIETLEIATERTLTFWE